MKRWQRTLPNTVPQETTPGVEIVVEIIKSSDIQWRKQQDSPADVFRVRLEQAFHGVFETSERCLLRRCITARLNHMIRMVSFVFIVVLFDIGF